MFYDTESNNHGLPFNPFKGCVVPRPIAWITSCDQQGNVNLAPYSYFNAVAEYPPMVIFSCTSRHANGGFKDTLRNVEETKEFVLNIASWDLREQVNLSSADFDHDISEIDITQLETVPSHYIKPPRIKKSLIHMECVYHQSIQLPVIDDKHTNRMIIGRVIGIHIDDSIIIDGKVDISRLKPIARMGYNEYEVIESKFIMERPKLNHHNK